MYNPWIFISSLLTTIPLVLIWLTGMVVALSNYRRHPPVSLLVLFASALMLLNLVGMNALQYWLASMGNAVAWEWFSLIRALISSTGYLLLLIAAFGWRSLGPLRHLARLDLDLPKVHPEKYLGQDSAAIRKE